MSSSRRYGAPHAALEVDDNMSIITHAGAANAAKDHQLSVSDLQYMIVLVAFARGSWGM